MRYAPRDEAEVEWSPDRYSIALARLEGFDAAVHLAGESIAEGRWTDEKKKRILESRTRGTQLLSDALANLSSPPKVLISASAIGYYGNRGDELLTEASAPGEEFSGGCLRSMGKSYVAREGEGNPHGKRPLWNHSRQRRRRAGKNVDAISYGRRWQNR